MATVGVDLGGTKILAVLTDGPDSDGPRIRSRSKRSTPRTGGPADVLDAMAATVAEADPDGQADRIGVGVPGPVVPGTGVLPFAANLPGWDHEVDVAAELSERCDGRPVVVGNDTNVATLAEHRLGAGRGVDNLLGVYMGTGVGSGLVLDGRLREGPRGLAGEIGHTYVAMTDRAGATVGRGELEDYAGRRMMETRARRRHAEGTATALVDLAGEGRMKSSIWEKALAEGDPLAVELVDDACEAMAAALASAIALVDIELVVLGGGMAERLGDTFRDDLTRRVADRAFAGVAAPVAHATLGSTGGALGAALLAETA